MKELKVLQLGRYFPPHIGGTETVIYDLVSGLNERGVKSDVLCCHDVNNYDEAKTNGYKVIRTKTILKIGSIALSPQQIFKLRHIWREYEIIQIHHPAPMATIALWAVRPSSKLIVYWHSDIVRQKILNIFFKPFQDWLVKKADLLIATTPNYDSNALKKYQKKTTFIPLGISGFKNLDADKVSKLRKKYNGKKIIFSLGRLVEYKGYKYLINSALYLGNDYIILIGGDGKLKNDLQNLIRRSGLENKVELLGKISEIELPTYFGACDLFCLSSISKNEAFGLVLPEAMSLAKPIVATRIPGSGVDWVNEDGVSGLNVEIKNPEALANAIKKILENVELKEKYGKGAFNRFHFNFRKETMVERFIKHYDTLTR